MGIRCPACGLVPVGPDAEALWQIDQQIHQLAGRRDEVLGRLRMQSAGMARPVAAATSDMAAPAVGDSPSAGSDPPPLPTFRPPPPPPWPLGPARVAGDAPFPGAGMSLPNLLLGLGTGLLVLAAIVFVAVSWAHLTAAAQGLVLVGLTATGAWGTRALRRQGLTATAEALGVVTVALLPVDAEAVREATQAPGITFGPDISLVVWCLVIGAMAAVSWWFGRFSGTRAPLVAAALAAQVPVPLLVVGWPVTSPAGQVLILAQSAVTLVAARRAGGADRAARTAALSGAGLLWIHATVAALVFDVDDATGRGVAALVVALAAAVAALAAALWADDDTARPLAAGTAAGVALTAAGLAVSVAVSGAAWWSVTAAVAVGAMAVAVRVPRRWGGAPAGVTGTAAGMLVLPFVVATARTALAALEVADRSWQHAAWTSTRLLADGALSLDAFGSGPLAAQLLVAAGGAVALRPRLGDRATVAALAGVGAAGLVLAPLLVDLPLAVTVAALIAGAGAACLTLVGLRREAATGPHAGSGTNASAGSTQVESLVPVAAVGLVTLTVLGLAWAAGSAATTVATVATIAVVAAAVGAAAGRDGDIPLAHAGAVVAVVAGVAEAGLVTAALGAAPATSWAAVALAAAAASAVGAVIDPTGTRRGVRGQVSLSTELAAAALHVGAALAVVGTGDPALTTAVLAGGAATAAVHALRPGRQPAAALAVVEGLVLLWLRLAWADVTVPEAYTLPVAAILLAAALVARRVGVADGLPSWNVDGPWLVAAVAPTVLLAIDDPGLVRPLGGLVVGVAVLVAGAVTRRRAAVDVGGVTVAVLGLHQLSPVVAELPNWVTLGTCGLVLLAVGATFEQRRRDLGILRTRYAELG